MSKSVKYCLIVAGVIAADRIIKILVSAFMYINESIDIFGDFFAITYIQNRGAAFSILSGHRWFLIGVTTAVLFVICIYWARHLKRGRKSMLTALSLILGGGIGNLLDRVMYGYVVDYLDFGSFPVFNLADICVCLGCGLLCIYVIFIDK